MCREWGENINQFDCPRDRTTGAAGAGRVFKWHKRFAFPWSCMSRLVTHRGALLVSYAGPAVGQWVTAGGSHGLASAKERGRYLDLSLVMAMASASRSYCSIVVLEGSA